MHFILKTSCALTIASKLRLGTLHKVFKKFGPDLEIKGLDGNVLTSFPSESLVSKRFFNADINWNPDKRFEKLSRAAARTIEVLGSPCLACESTSNVEMHHVRKLRSTTERIKMDYFTSLMSRMNRKQIPLCRPCHVKLHKGTLAHFKIPSQDSL